jgi:choline dehydrogenase
MSVVDSNFRVIGTRNLRVVDASVFPTIPGYYVTVPILMMSEKASDVILAKASRDRR